MGTSSTAIAVVDRTYSSEPVNGDLLSTHALMSRKDYSDRDSDDDMINRVKPVRNTYDYEGTHSEPLI